MTCAMRLHDPCDGDVSMHRLIVRSKPGCRVPLCWKHVEAWDNWSVPFQHLGESGREKWARWAADRATRQEYGAITTQRVTVIQ